MGRSGYPIHARNPVEPLSECDKEEVLPVYFDMDIDWGAVTGHDQEAECLHWREGGGAPLITTSDKTGYRVPYAVGRHALNLFIPELRSFYFMCVPTTNK
jgi:hypothetical protein